MEEETERTEVYLPNDSFFFDYFTKKKITHLEIYLSVRIYVSQCVRYAGIANWPTRQAFENMESPELLI